MEEEMEEIYFSRGRNTKFQKLSNAFGPVYWLSMQKLFKKKSIVAMFLKNGLDKYDEGFEAQEFVKLLTKFRPKMKKIPSEYEGEVPSGILASLTSSILEKGNTGKIIMQHLTETPMTKKEYDYAAKAVASNASKDDQNKALYVAMRRKFEIPLYRDLLLKTGDAILHEATSATSRSTEFPVDDFTYLAPNAYQKLVIYDGKEAWRGGDLTGKFLMQIRDEIRDELAGAQAE